MRCPRRTSLGLGLDSGLGLGSELKLVEGFSERFFQEGLSPATAK